MKTRYRVWTFACVVLAASAAAEAGSVQEPVDNPFELNEAQAITQEYRVNPSDVLALDFRYTPELNQSVTVRPDGFITLHGVGELRAAGLSIRELTKALEQAYGSMLRDPVISVSVSDFRKPYVTVNGEVERPGQYELRGTTTLTELLSVAGGLRDSAKRSEIWLFRRQPNGAFDARQIDVRRILSDGNLGLDPRLSPFDVIFVPKSTWSKVERFVPVPGIGFFPFP
jgi:polysaccharide export outer membrane protein